MRMVQRAHAAGGTTARRALSIKNWGRASRTNIAPATPIRRVRKQPEAATDGLDPERGRKPSRGC